MKAIRKEDGKEIDVILTHPKEYIETEVDAQGRRRIYNEASLIVDEPTNWEDFRRKTAQVALYGLIAKNGYSLQPIDDSIAIGNFEANKPILDKKAREFAYSAVVYADALIAELRKNN